MSISSLETAFPREGSGSKPKKDRASVAGALIESLHGEADPDAEDAWDTEIQRRVKELDSGKVETIPWTEVRKRLFRGAGR